MEEKVLMTNWEILNETLGEGGGFSELQFEGKLTK